MSWKHSIAQSTIKLGRVKKAYYATIQIVLHYRRKFNKVNERKKTKNSRITKYVSSNKNIWPLADSQF